MDIKKVEQRDGKARRTFNVSEEHTYIHPEYDIVMGSEEIGSTGLLAIVRLRPKNTKTGTSPEFVLRWDNKDNQLDVDAVNVSEKEQSAFRKPSTGYYGHHPARIGAGNRIFEVNVRWRGQQIYCGKVRFNLGREVESIATMGYKPSASTRSTRGIR
jgi:hypothetical protein